MAAIVIDCRFASSFAGLGTYIRCLVPQLVKFLPEDDCVLVVRDRAEAWLSAVPSHVRIVCCNSSPYGLSEQWAIPLLLRKLHADVYFCPHFNVPLLCPVPYVMTVHDLILHRYPNCASLFKRQAYRLLIRRAVRRAKAIIAVSTFTASEIAAQYGESANNKTIVVTESVSSEFRSISPSQQTAVLRKYDLQKGYLLYVGGAKEHKNIPMLLRAHARVSSAPELVLVSSGKEAARLPQQARVHFLSDVAHADLPALYSAARCFVTPSLYEGFCLPILEARACKSPVVAFRVTAIPEVAGDHALLVEPNQTALESALRNLPSDHDPLSPQYSWVKAAQQTAGILTSVVDG